MTDAPRAVDAISEAYFRRIRVDGKTVVGDWHALVRVYRDGQLIGRCATRTGADNAERADQMPRDGRWCYLCSHVALRGGDHDS